MENKPVNAVAESFDSTHKVTAHYLRHEINNPLTVILGNLELIRTAGKAGKVDLKTIERNLEKIESHALRIAKTLKDLEKK